MTSLPPEVLKFLEWLKKTEGRDKLYRLIAYGSKIPIQVLKTNGGSKDTIERLTKGAKSIGLSRKLLRMFRSIQFLQDFLQATGKADPFERSLGSIKGFSLMMWMLADHAQWMHKVGYITLESEKKISEMHSKSWFFGLLASILLGAYKLNKAQQSKSKDPENELKIRKGLLKSSLDIIVPMQRLGWLGVSDGVVGVAGTITSIMGIYDSYPK